MRVFALACQGELKAAQLAVQVKALEIEKLRFQIAKLRRMQFGRSSERITRQIEQLELQLEELETGEAEDIAGMEPQADELGGPVPHRTRPKRKPLPDHLPREEVMHQPEANGACVCPACGGGMGKLGEDVTEVLDYVPGHFRVIRHLRPKYACQACDVITQAPAPAMPTPRGRATPPRWRIFWSRRGSSHKQNRRLATMASKIFKLIYGDAQRLRFGVGLRNPTSASARAR